MSKQQRPNIPLPPAVQPHELQYKILREKQALERASMYERGSPSGGRASSRSGVNVGGDRYAHHGYYDDTTGSSGRGQQQGGDTYYYSNNNDTVSDGRRSGSRRGYEGGGESQRSGSQRSAARTSSTARTGTSISSSVALSTLNKLESMLLEERKARQGAESMLLSLQKERVAREDAVRQSEATKKQLDALMGALRSVVKDPSSSNNVQKLQSLLDNTHVDKGAYNKMRAEAAAADRGEGADRFAKNGTSLSPPVDSKYSKKVAHSLPPLHSGDSESSTRSGVGGQKTFLDGLGHYERVKERERQQEKLARRGHHQTQ